MKIEDLKEEDLVALEDCYEDFIESHPLEELSFNQFVIQIIENVKGDCYER